MLQQVTVKDWASDREPGRFSVRLGVMVPHLMQETSGIAPWLEF